MTLALIQKSPPQIVGTYADGTSVFKLPNGDDVHGATAGWDNGTYAVIAVAPFVPPSGQVTVGAPDYSIDASGAVTETYQTAVPVPPVPSCQLWQLQAVMTTDQWTAAQAAVAALNNPAVTAFFAHGTNVIPANSTTLLGLGEAIGLTADQVAALVVQAAAVAIP